MTTYLNPSPAYSMTSSNRRSTNDVSRAAHIGIFMPSLDGGGAEKVILALSGEFADRGHSVDLMVASRRGRLAGNVTNKVRLVDFGAKKPLHAVPSLFMRLRRERFDCLLSTVLNSNIAALLAHRLARIPTRCVIREANYTEHDIDGSTAISTWVNSLSVRRLYPYADAVIAVSEGVGDSLRTFVGVQQRRIHVIPNPLIPEDSDPEIRPRPTPPETVPLIVACGRLQPQKDHLTLLRSFALLRSRVVARLLILGEGPELQSLISEADRLRISADVEFLGFHPYPQQIMRSAKVFAHTSRWEGFSSVLLEALASGCTVVATDCPGGVREALGDGKFGHLVPVGDICALASIMEKALIGKNALANPHNYLRKFELSQVADRYLSVLLPGPPVDGTIGQCAA